jgi:rhodanese-related sulfurtransferase
MSGQTPKSFDPKLLHTTIGTAAAPVVIDVRRAPAFDQGDVMIVGARRRSPDDVQDWAKALPRDQSVVVYCVHGHEVSQGVAVTLASLGFNASYLEDGIAEWVDKKLPTRRKFPPSEKWVTRERPKIDRIACPWLVRRFVNPDAEFIYVPATKVMETAARAGATPYDVSNVDFGHRGAECSFDAFIRIFEISDPVLDRLAAIVRGADTGRLDLTPQSAGLLAVSTGLSMNFQDDHAMLAEGMVIYDALYSACRHQTSART